MDEVPLSNDPGRGSAEAIRRIVVRHPAVDPREAAARRRFLDELDRLPAPCDEHADLVHVTASGVVVGERGTVLHRHRRLGRWMQPGGHIAVGETPPGAALRESGEETGVRLSHPEGDPLLLRLDVHAAALGHTHLDLCYLLVGADDDPVPAPGESPDARWCSWEEAAALGDEAVRRVVSAARDRWEMHRTEWSPTGRAAGPAARVDRHARG